MDLYSIGPNAYEVTIRSLSLISVSLDWALDPAENIERQARNDVLCPQFIAGLLSICQADLATRSTAYGCLEDESQSWFSLSLMTGFRVY